MAGIRVHKLANELGLSSKELLDALKKQGIVVKNHMSSIEPETVKIVRELFSRDVSKPKKVDILKEDNEKIDKKKSGMQKELNVDVKVKTALESDMKIPETENSRRKINLSEAITVKELAEKIGCKGPEVIKKLMSMGIMATLNQSLDSKAVKNVAKEFNVEVEIIPLDINEELSDEIIPSNEEKLVFRSPVVTIMGHVDHGKTRLLDTIRDTKVIDKEAGGITQHLGAYKVKLEKGEIVFLDTPGHEAFTAMRARGVKLTDIVVLVVAADDGVMPQTIEAINHAKAGKVPIVVAINKIDKPEANSENVKRKLAEHNLVPEDWGGDTIFAEVSAKQNIGIENLLEMILLQAEIMELKADPAAMGKGIVIEANLDKGRGPVATVLVQKGTLKLGQPFVVGMHYGKIRALFNYKGEKIKKAPPSTPVEILGFSSVPNAGDPFIVVSDEKKARQIGNMRLGKQRVENLSSVPKVTLEDLYSQINKGNVKELKVIIKADVQGSVQALTESIEKLSTEEIRVNIIHGATGGITETDIILASASNAVVIGFNIRPQEKNIELAKKEMVEIKLYTVIYKVLLDIKSAMEGLLDPTIVEKVTGRAEVREVIEIPKVGTIAGCYVTSGVVKRNSETRLIRDNVIVYQGKIGSLRRFKDDAKEVASGFECGIGIEKYQDIKQGDIIEPFENEKVRRVL